VQILPLKNAKIYVEICKSFLKVINIAKKGAGAFRQNQTKNSRSKENYAPLLY
jgi:hypothetical protein